MLDQQPDGTGAAVPSQGSDKDREVLRRFVVDGRLVSIPAQRGKRLVVLDHLAGLFEPGVRYTEAEVNQALAAYHPDYATLRRCLVDEEFLDRERGVYWRTGGTVDVDGPGETSGTGPA
jgi:hypothetical protein